MPLGDYDWLVVSGSTVAHPRWTEIFGGAPPLAEAAQAPGVDVDGALGQAIKTIAELGSLPVTAAMMAWQRQTVQEIGEGRDATADASPPSPPPSSSSSSSSSASSAAEAIASLPFRVLNIVASSSSNSISGGNNNNGGGGVGKLQRVVVGGTPSFPTLVLHSTSAFSATVSDLYGATSSAARLHGTGRSDAAREADIVGGLVDECRAIFTAAGWHAAAEALPDGSSGPNPGPPASCSWGPHLHRWGSAFPSGEPLSSDAAFVSGAQVAFCGDFIATDSPLVEAAAAAAGGEKSAAPAIRMGGVESAVLSGMHTARRLHAALASCEEAASSSL